MQYIQEAARGFDAGTMFVSFSGGKDSTAVSDLVMRALGRSDVLHIFGNTTLEFPQTINYVSSFRKDHPTTPMLRAENRQQDFYTLCELFGPPSRMLRWCCTIFKTGYIGDKIKRTFADAKQVLVFNGIRRNESTSRSKYAVPVRNMILLSYGSRIDCAGVAGNIVLRHSRNRHHMLVHASM